MFWRGGISPGGFWNKDGWYRSTPSMGQNPPEVACEGPNNKQCEFVASRLTQDQAKVVLERIKAAQIDNPTCVEGAGSSLALKSILSTLDIAASGIEETAALTPVEAEFLKNFEGCMAGSVPGKTVAAPMPPLPGSGNIPVNTLLIGGGILLGLFVLGFAVASAK